MIWVLLSAGRGPGECKIAAKGFLRELLAEASGVKVEASVIDLEEASYGLMSALVSLEEDDADALARSWEGTVKLVCPSPFRPGWGRKNWFIGVSRLSPPPPSQALREGDFRIDTMRSSGPGGQHVNRTESAVRIHPHRNGRRRPRGAQPFPEPGAGPRAAGGGNGRAGTGGGQRGRT
jgi:peptide chain release factor